MSECLDLCALPVQGSSPVTSPSGVFSSVTPVLVMPTLPLAQTALSCRLANPATLTGHHTPNPRPHLGRRLTLQLSPVLCLPHVLVSAYLLALPQAGPPTSMPDSGTGYKHLLCGTFQLVPSLPSRPHPPQSTVRVARGASPWSPAQNSRAVVPHLSLNCHPLPYSKSQCYPLTPHTLAPDPDSPFRMGSFKGTHNGQCHKPRTPASSAGSH